MLTDVVWGSHRERETMRCSLTASAECGYTMKRKSGKKCSVRLYQVTQVCVKSVAGAVGFEPTNAGIKNRCLRPLGYAPFAIWCGPNVRAMAADGNSLGVRP